jgi:hypothetical protein
MIPNNLHPDKNQMVNQQASQPAEEAPIYSLPKDVLQVILSSFDDPQTLDSQSKIWQKLITPQVVNKVLSNEFEKNKEILIKESFLKASIIHKQYQQYFKPAKK